MNARTQMFYSTRWFQVGVFVALAVVVMAGAAFWFGIGLQADTTKSVAASPIGSSLATSRGLVPAAGARSVSLAGLAAIRSNVPAGLSNLETARAASLVDSRLDDYYGRLTPARSAKLQDLAKRWATFYAGLDKAMKDAGERP